MADRMRANKGGAGIATVHLPTRGGTFDTGDKRDKAAHKASALDKA